MPAVVYLLVFYLYPLIRILLLSVFDGGFTLRHYHQMFTSGVYLTILINTLQTALIVTALCLAMGYPLAFLLATSSERTRNLVTIAVVLPYFTSILVRSYSWLVILGRQGLVNEALRTLNLIERPIKMIYNTTGVMIGMTHILLPVMVLALYSIMRTINWNLGKVSASLGAQPIQTFLRVYFPLTLPGVGAGCILVFIFAVGFYITPALLGGVRDTMLSMLIATQINELLNWGFGAALSVLLLTVTLCLFVGFNRMMGLDRIWGGETVRTTARRGTIRTRLTAVAMDASQRGLGGIEGVILALTWSFTAVVRVAISIVRPTRRTSRRVGAPRPRLLLACVVGLVLVFLLAPILLIFPLSFTSSLYLRFPPSGFSLQWYRELWETPFWLNATWLSLRVAFASMAASVLLGTLAGLALSRASFPGKDAVYLFLLSPLIVPVIVIAVALYYSLSRIGLVGTFWGLVIAHTIGALPLVTVLVASALKGFDVTLENAAMSLGASPVRTGLQITLPIIRPTIIVAAFFAFMHSFDEVVIASFVGGVSAETLPKKMWEGVRLEIKPHLAAISSILVAFTALMLLAVALVQRRRRPIAGA